ncbi:hypothetical protein BT69DRAFT_1279853, partial [Atractiella rhizophila]
MTTQLLLLTLTFASPAFAIWGDCWRNSNGDIVCDGLSYGARVGITVGVSIAVFIILVTLGIIVRKRRLARYKAAQAAWASQPQPQGSYYGQQYGAYPQQGYGQGGWQQGPPQYTTGQYPPQEQYAPYAPPPASPPPAAAKV